jgi:hypothetical protein
VVEKMKPKIKKVGLPETKLGKKIDWRFVEKIVKKRSRKIVEQ